MHRVFFYVVKAYHPIQTLLDKKTKQIQINTIHKKLSILWGIKDEWKIWKEYE